MSDPARQNLTFGSISMQVGWEVRSQITLLEPPQSGLSVPLAGKTDASQSPRANLVLSARQQDGDLGEVLNEVFKELAQSLPQMKKEEPQAFTFSDGNQGLYASISFSIPQMSVTQAHIVRQDGDTMTHIVATVDTQHIEKLDVLKKLAQSFQPTSI